MEDGEDVTMPAKEDDMQYEQEDYQHEPVKYNHDSQYVTETRTVMISPKTPGGEYRLARETRTFLREPSTHRNVTEDVAATIAEVENDVTQIGRNHPDLR